MPLPIKPLTPERKIALARVNVRRKQKRLFKRLKFNDTNVFTVANAKFLARENILTLLFVERLQRQTNRPILVVPIGKTGEPYTWGIAATNPRGITLAENVAYPSTKSKPLIYLAEIDKLTRIHKSIKDNPLLVCVDSSSEARMPSSFVGYEKKLGYTKIKQSIKSMLEARGYNVILAGYNYSTQKQRMRFFWEKREKDKLPKNIKINNSEKTVILFNPSKERKVKINDGTSNAKWSSAFHDDNMSGVPQGFKEYVKNQVILAKK